MRTIIVSGLILVVNLSFGQKNFEENIYPELKAGKFLVAIDLLEKEITKKEKNSEYLKYWQAIALVEIAKSQRTEKALDLAKNTLKTTLDEVFNNQCDVKKKTAEYYGFEKMKGDEICAKAKQNLIAKEKELEPVEQEIEERKSNQAARKKAAEKRKKAEDAAIANTRMDEMPDFAEELENKWKVIELIAGEEVIKLDRDDKRFIGSSWVVIHTKVENTFQSNRDNFVLGRWQYKKEGDKEKIKFYTVFENENGSYTRSQDIFELVKFSKDELILSNGPLKYVLKAVR